MSLPPVGNAGLPRRRAWHPWRGVAGLPAAMWWLALATLVNRCGTMVLPYLALYLVTDLRSGDATAGAIVSLYGLVALCISPFAGRLTDRIGPLRLMGASMLLAAGAYLLFPLARSVVAVSAATVLLALVHEPFRPASLTLVGQLAPREQRRAAFALNRLAMNLGMSIGPSLGGVLATIDFALLFWVNAASSAATALTLLAVRRARAPRPRAAIVAAGGAALSGTAAAGSAAAPASAMGAAAADPPALTPAPARSLLGDRNFVWFLFASFLTAVVFFQYQTAMALYVARDLGHGERFYGFAFAVNPVLIVLLEVWVVDRLKAWPLPRVLAIGALLVAVGFGALAVVTSKEAIVATIVVWTFGEMLLFPSMVAYISDIAPPGRTGAAMGLYSTSFASAFTVGPALGTWLLASHGPVWCWSVMGLIGVAAAFAMARLRSGEPAAKPAA